jgi:hypothetical protein
MEHPSGDSVRIAIGGDTLTISWEAREKLLDRLARIPSGESLVGLFQRHGTSSIVIPDRDELAVLRDVVWQWMDDVGRDQLPYGIPELRDALVDSGGPSETA